MKISEFINACFLYKLGNAPEAHYNSDAERAKDLIKKFFILEEEITCADFSE